MAVSDAIRGLLDLLYPPRCPACDASIDGRAALCPVCEVSLYPLGTACTVCAQPLEARVPIRCRRCAKSPPPFETIAAPYRYGGELAVALQRLKYDRRLDIARTLAPLLAPALAEASAEVEVIVPVPLHWRRQSKRGFNQASVLVEQARTRGGAPVDAISLRRRRATASQAGLTARERARNVAGAFAVVRRRRPRIEGRRVLLVDDVITTGATVAAASRALLDAGAASVRGLCLARAEN
jgi:ComF family protein